MMGQNDLREMSAGRMDPSGRGITMTGYVMGIIGTILSVLNMIAGIIMVASGGLT